MIREGFVEKVKVQLILFKKTWSVIFDMNKFSFNFKKLFNKNEKKMRKS